MEEMKKRKASSLEEPDERKKRRTDLEEEMQEMLSEISDMSSDSSRVGRALELQSRAHVLSREILDLVESDPEPEIEIPRANPKMTMLQLKRLEKKTRTMTLERQNKEHLRLEREKDRRNLYSEFVSSMDTAVAVEMEKESKEAYSEARKHGVELSIPTTIDEFQPMIVERATEIWKLNTKTRWNPLPYHDCRTGGEVHMVDTTSTNLTCKNCGKTVQQKERSCYFCRTPVVRGITTNVESCPMTQINLRVFFIPSQKGKLHVCVENMCQADGPMSMQEDSHDCEIKQDISLFICNLSGIPHLCGSDCKTESVNKDFEYVCVLTGISQKQTEKRGSNWQPPGTKTFCDAWKTNPLERRVPRRLKTPMETELIKHLLDTEVLYHNSGFLQSKVMPSVREMIREICPKTDMDARKIAFSAVHLKILCVFSDDRFSNDAKQNEKKRLETSNMLDKYIGRCEQQSKPGNAADMFSIINTRRLRTCYNPQVNLDKETKFELAAYYAKKVLLLWYIIVTKTTEGKANPGRFQIDDFVTTALHLFHTGLEIPENSNGSRIQLVGRDPLFAVFPITSWIEEKLHPRIRESKKRNKSISRMKKAVKMALKGALEKGTSPEDLKTERISYLEMDDKVFGKLRKS
jgi:hypothetical protein